MIVFITLLCGSLGTDIRADLIAAKDSSEFTYKYEGDAITQDGTTASGFGNTDYAGSMTGSTLVSDGNILSVTTTGPSVLYLQNSTWIAQAVGSVGWTWEASIKMANLASNTLNLRVGDGDDADLEDIFIWWPDRMRSAWTDGWGVMDTTDGFHTYRVAQAANSDLYNVWIDGQLVTEYDFSGGGGYAGTDHWFGDGGGTFGEFEVDYIRWTTDGFAPFNDYIVKTIETQGSTEVNEEGETIDSYFIGPVVNPNATLTVTIVPDNANIALNGQAAGDSLVLNFEPTQSGEAPPAETVNVQAVDDVLTEYTHTTSLVHTIQTTDTRFDTDPNDVIVYITDNDVIPPFVDPVKDSSQFFYKYEGDAVTQNGSTASGFGNTGFSGSMNGSTLSSDGDILSVTTTPAGVLYLQNANWVTNCLDENGWTWEMKAKMISPDPVGTAVFSFSVSDGDASKRDIIFWTTDRIRTSFTDGWGLMNTTDDFHVYRAGQLPGSPA